MKNLIIFSLSFLMFFIVSCNTLSINGDDEDIAVAADESQIPDIDQNQVVDEVADADTAEVQDEIIVQDDVQVQDEIQVQDENEVEDDAEDEEDEEGEDMFSLFLKLLAAQK